VKSGALRECAMLYVIGHSNHTLLCPPAAGVRSWLLGFPSEASTETEIAVLDEESLLRWQKLQ